MGIPLLDASNFRTGSPSIRKKYVQDLCASLSAHGAVRLSNHGILDDVVKDFFELVSISMNFEPSLKTKIDIIL